MKPSTLFRPADELPSRTLVHTGNETLDRLLGGGLELGMCHLFYGDRILHDDLLRMAVAAQLPRAKGGLGSPSIFIDSADMMRVDRIADSTLGSGLFLGSFRQLSLSWVSDRMSIFPQFKTRKQYIMPILFFMGI
ncbi:MAG: hypothetical protein ACFFER_04775 [Candidatus Thorarchaeota archaeon]